MFILRNIPKEEYYSKELDNAVKDFLMKFYTENVPEKVGRGKCTVGFLQEYIKVKEFVKLSEIISEKILEAKFIFSKNDSDFIVYTNAWINEVYKGSSGKIHSHESTYPHSIDGVAIFYYKVPEKGSHFIVVDENCFKEENLHVEDYTFHEKSNLKVHTGDLIIHDSNLLHGVSEHQSDESRICFVFNFKFAKKNV